MVFLLFTAPKKAAISHRKFAALISAPDLCEALAALPETRPAALESHSGDRQGRKFVEKNWFFSHELLDFLRTISDEI